LTKTERKSKTKIRLRDLKAFSLILSRKLLY